VMVLGSAGRGESQLAPDQDNAIVYADGGEASAADQWFAAMAVHMTDILDASGVPLCKGGVMARNRAWRMDVRDWTRTIDGWVRRQRPEDLLNVDIFFDAVPVYGASELAERLWSHAYDQAHASRPFQSLLTENARNVARPFTLFGGFRTDEKGRIDLKRYGLMPLFTSARVLSIRHGVRERSSAARMQGFGAKTGHNAEEIERIVAAQETLLGFVIGQQLIDIESGVPPSTRIVASRLSAAEKSALKAALNEVASAVALVSEGRV
jgi:CBS domain-containing protein